MLDKSKLLTLETMVYGYCILMSTVIGPKWPFLLMYMYSDVDVGTGGSWVELPYKGDSARFFVSSVGLPDIYEYSVG